MSIRDNPENDARLAGCARPHAFRALPDPALPERLWRRKCARCGGVVKGRDFPIHLDGVSDGEMRAAARFRELAERFRDLEARFQDLTERLPELAAEPLP